MGNESDTWLVAVEHNDVRQMTLDQLDAAYRVELVSDATLVRSGAMRTWEPLGAVLAKGGAPSKATDLSIDLGKIEGPRFEVRLPDRTRLAGLDAGDLETGLRAGWLGLSDEARVQSIGNYRPLHEVASDVFFVAVHHDAKRAHARRTAQGLAVGAAIVVGGGGFVAGCMSSFGVGLPAAAAALVVTVGAFYLLGKSPNFVVTGLVVVVAGGLLALLTGMKFTLWSVLGFVFGAVLGIALSGGVGAAVGYGLGYVLGYVVGARARVEPLPEVRVPPPRAMLVLHLAGPTHERSADEAAGGADAEAEPMDDAQDLIEACALGQVDVARRFLVAGADPNQRQETGWGGTPLAWASSHGVELVELLLSSGAVPTVDDCVSAIAHGAPAVPALQRMLDARPGLDVTHLLFEAVTRKNLDATSLLLERGADWQGKVLRRPLEHARKYGTPEIVALLQSRA